MLKIKPCSLGALDSPTQILHVIADFLLAASIRDTSVFVHDLAVGGLGMGLITLSGHAATFLQRAKVNAFSLNNEEKQ